MRLEWVFENEGAFPFWALQESDEGRHVAVVTVRRGGFSEGPFEGLNLSYAVGDERSRVMKNRRLLMRTLGLKEKDCAWPEQIHGAAVSWANAPGVFQGTDGLASARPALCMAVLVADCVPVFVLDERLSLAGVAHAGRKGTALGITRNLVRLIASASGAPTTRLAAALGPSVGPCCYEVDRTTASALPGACLKEREGRVFFDLWEANILQAVEEGVPRENTLMPPACTCCNPETFFSHRAHRGRTGRQMALTVPGGLK
jgi:YfiH family protein